LERPEQSVVVIPGELGEELLSVFGRIVLYLRQVTHVDHNDLVQQCVLNCLDLRLLQLNFLIDLLRIEFQLIVRPLLQSVKNVLLAERLHVLLHVRVLSLPDVLDRL